MVKVVREEVVGNNHDADCCFTSVVVDTANLGARRSIHEIGLSVLSRLEKHHHEDDTP